MLHRLFTPAPLIDAESLAFMQQVQAWARARFGQDYFDARQLVLPTNSHFPDRLHNVEEMAVRTLERMLGYAGLSHWPTTLTTDTTLPLQLPEGLGGPDAAESQASTPLVLRYNPLQASNPQAMIASHAQQLGACLLALAAEAPPATPEQLPLIAELLAVQLGFGIQLANSAFAFQGGCGGCRRSASDRIAYLNQDEALMALALFCQAKGIATKEVTPYLHRHLRKVYKQAQHQLDRDTAG